LTKTIQTNRSNCAQRSGGTPKPHGGGHPPSVRATGETFLTELIESQPDWILEEMRDKYNEYFEPVGRSTIDRTLTRLKLTRKKNS
jgi:hypothetical protein